MSYYTLKKEFCLRGWQKLPYAIVKRPDNQVVFLSKRVFDTLRYCDGQTDFDLPLFPAYMRDMLKQLTQEGVIVESDNESSLAEDQVYRFFENRFIRTAHWSITGKCNYLCKHCYMSAPDAKLGELDSSVILDIIEQLDNCGVMEVTITGGEPLIRKDWWDIIDALVAKKIRIRTIYSNGKLVNRKLLEGLAARGLFPEFNMSYDGDEGWHDWLRGIKNAGQIVLDAFDLCHEMGFPTGAELCLHQGNKHLLRQSINTLAEHHCAHVKTNPVADSELWQKYGEDYSLSIDETYAIYLDYIPQFFADGMPIGLMLSGFFRCAKGKTSWQIPLKKYQDGSDTCLRQTVCGHARQTLYISPESRMLPCLSLSSFDIQYEYPLITEIGLQKGLSDSKYMELIDTRVEDFFAMNRECDACEYKIVCAGGCRASALSFDPSNIMSVDKAACGLFKGGYEEKITRCAKEAIQKYCGATVRC